MKIIFFNVNKSKIDPVGLANFIKSHSTSTDVFCFQEAEFNMNQIVNEIIPQFKKRIGTKYPRDTHRFEILTCIAPNIDFDDFQILMPDDDQTGLALYTKIRVSNKYLHLLNIHGISHPNNKEDTEGRLQQSKVLINFLANKNEPKVIGGDFNLLNTTKSVGIFEENGYRDLIKDYKITNTRNEVIWKKFPDSKQYYADFAFVSSDIKVRSFEVPYNEVSDHLPMILEIEL